MTLVPHRLRPALTAVIARVVAGDFDGLVRDGYAPAHRGADLGLWVREYPAHLISFPDEGWCHSDAIAINGRPDQWSVTVPLWTHEEGRSDLTLEATAIEKDDRVQVEIDNIHTP